MEKHNLFIGFKNQKAETLILSLAEDERDAMDCDYYVKVDNPEHIRTNVLQWLEDRTCTVKSDLTGEKR